MLFWILILCHLIADYPLQSNGMVEAKKTFFGLLVHVSIHFLTMIVILCALLKVELIIGFGLAFVISFFHFVIDYWKNILSTLKPKWVIFTYIQDQILHVFSIILVTFLALNYVPNHELPIIINNIIEHSSGYKTAITINWGEVSLYIYTSFFLLATHFWFITEKVLSYKHSAYHKTTLWPRMIGRAIIFSSLVVGLNVWSLVIFILGIIVVWFDIEKKNRYQILSLDIIGTILLVTFAKWIAN